MDPGAKKCGVVVVDPEGRVLIVEGRALHPNAYETMVARKWGLPKGHREEGEAELDCAVREVREETGLDVVITESTPHFRVSDTLLYFLRVNSDFIGGVTSDVTEIRTVKWVKPRDIIGLNCNRGLKALMMNYRNYMRRAGMPA
jgi:bis(5'-nucleosidyl)-tetraphosphatase